MKKAFKVLGYALLSIVLIIFLLLVYVKTALPNVGDATQLTITYTPEKIERGKYLANHVTVCTDCHSTRDWSRFSGPLVEGTLGKGGERFDQQAGFPGVFYSKNITPAGISRYTDGELFRLITTGVTKEGRAMFPVMPYSHYGQMDAEDIQCIIAYIRSLSPIENAVPESVADFPMNFIINTIPAKANLQKLPPKTDQLAYGRYMANAASCIECHTPVKKGQIIEALAFGGGREFNMPDGMLRSSNISPDSATGIGTWTEEIFINKFRLYADSSYQLPVVKPGEFNTIMPWKMYSGMTEEDLKAIYHYLKTVKPVSNQVEKFSVHLPAK
ncbi:cytochrome C [Terrimonas sp.]|uniref:c-type cytochrome n=1 Tax=Terrimonas sp. TaxID=1914338 RepID=UPI000D5164D5|nr:c-type cytochrome [Terrimonas sp.]PVD50547.1 cytochrome C [Terrimonas sp.]